MTDSEYDYLYKFVVVGDSGVGKTQLIERYSRNTFNLESKSTIGVEFSTKSVTVNDSKIKLQLWDTAGQERYRAITSAYYRGARGIILCFDITKRITFENIIKQNGWLSEAQNHCSPDALITLVGTKCDMRHLRSVPFDEPNDFAKLNNFDYVETSSLDNINVDSLFVKFATKIYENTTPKELNNSVKNEPLSECIKAYQPIKLETRSVKQQGKCC